jgi:hypothetical protein
MTFQFTYIYREQPLVHPVPHTSEPLSPQGLFNYDSCLWISLFYIPGTTIVISIWLCSHWFVRAILGHARTRNRIISQIYIRQYPQIIGESSTVPKFGTNSLSSFENDFGLHIFGSRTSHFEYGITLIDRFSSKKYVIKVPSLIKVQYSKYTVKKILKFSLPRPKPLF